MGEHGVIRRYRRFLPVSEDTPVISLNEGGTPLIEAPGIVNELGGDFQLFVKYEGLNP
ncbi:MAG: threonine synthase, partial [Candidatus Thermoplasmatota archaeon]|nr:threonine synthase [Candidatus Thermoplasmatota archaeon]